DDDSRVRLTKAILGCEENARTIAEDNKLTLMTWYGIEPIVMSASGILKSLDSNSKLQQFAVRRLAYEIAESPESAESALAYIGEKAASSNMNEEARAAELLMSF